MTAHTSLLDGRKAIVTGGGGGIGLAIGTALAEHGADVLLADIDADRAAAAAETVRETVGSGRTIESVGCDVSDEASVDALVKHAVARFGRLDIMVNNAGITRDATMRRMTAEDFDSVIAVHLRGAWLGTRAASLVMREQKVGSIINIASTSGKQGMAGQTNYSSAKAGMIGLTKAAAKELGWAGVRVNAVLPGLVRSPMTEAMREDVWEQKIKETPLGRVGEPSDVAGPVVFLASDLASYVTGDALLASGGRAM